MNTLIVRLAARGDGMTADGRAVPFAAPGDHVDDAGAILPGAHHATPPCRHFPTCGGCTLQHIDDAAYRDYLVDRIKGALGAQGLVAEIATPHLSPPRTRRRASLRAERMGRRVLLGFNERASRRIVDLSECWVLLPALFQILAPLRALLAMLVPDRRGAGIELALADQGVDVLISGIEPSGLAAAEAITAFAQSQRLARLSIDCGLGAEARWEPEPVTVTLGGVPVGLPAGGFLQATADGEAALLGAIRESVHHADTIADLFAGLGTFTLPLAASARVLAAEGARDAVLALKAAAGAADETS